jgi:putative transposase
MKQEGIKAQFGYRKPRHRGGNQHVVVLHLLQREFNPDTPNTVWVADITYSVLGVQH